jgi:hypothetical protein
MEFLKSAGGKVVGGLVALVVVAAAIAWFQASPESRERWVGTFGRGLGWTLIALAVPWVSYPLIGWVKGKRSNLAGVILVGSLTFLEALVLLWMFDFTIRGTLGWTFFGAGILIAGVYNTFACDFIASRIG